MGNQSTSNKNTFDMHLKVIGAENNKLNELYENSKILVNIKKYWIFDRIEFTDFKTQLNNYFTELENVIIKEEDNKPLNTKETLIVIVKNASDPEIESVIKKIDNLQNKEYMPIVLFLTKEGGKKKILKLIGRIMKR